MNKFPYQLACLTSLILFSGASHADLAEESGFEFILNVGVGAGESTSQLNTGDKNKTTSDLNSNGTKVDGISPIVLGNMSYTLDSLKTQFFLGQSESEVAVGDFQLELGVSHQFGNETILTLAYIPRFPFAQSEVWEDPFLTGKDRTTTKQDTQAARIQVENIAGLPITLKYGYGERELETEKSGSTGDLGLTSEQLKLLDRDTTYHRAAVEFMLPLGDTWGIMPELAYMRSDAKGKAMSSDTYQGQLTFLMFDMGQHSLNVSGSYSHSEYDESHPVFSKVREDSETGMFAFYSYAQPFGWDNAAISMFGGWSQNDSNINFYDKEEFGASVGVAYRF